MPRLKPIYTKVVKEHLEQSVERAVDCMNDSRVVEEHCVLDEAVP